MATKMLKMPYRPEVQFQGHLPTLASIYKTLGGEEFRLLQVHGYDDFGILRCSLRHIPFREDAVIPYAAISYTWNEAEKIWYGDYDTSPKPIRVDGAAVLVSDKVANIICLAEEYSKAFIWIDAICINQINFDEKSHQVARMGAIYSCALEVLAFLGSPTAGTDELIEQMDSHRRTGELGRLASPRSVAAVFNFLRNDYWRRAWVFQEIALAKTIVIFRGSKVMPFETLSGVSTQLAEQHPEFGKVEGIRGILRTLKLLRHMGPVRSQLWKDLSIDVGPQVYAMKGIHSTFLDVLDQAKGHNRCHDPRDLLYSRMAVASDATVMIPYPDYQMPVEDLYKRFATNHIVQSRTVEIITFATHTPMSLPTWVPDWTSLSPGWIYDNVKYNQMKYSLDLLHWQDVGLPRVSQCRSEIMVQGKCLKTIEKRDYVGLSVSATLDLTHAAERHPFSEVPRPGDLICVLRRCPLLAYLRPVDQHFVIIGRTMVLQDKLFLPDAGLVTAIQTSEKDEDKTWKLNSIEEVQSKPEEIFRIR